MNDEKIGERTTDKTKKKLHRTIRDISHDLPRFKYNTAIARFMEFINVLKQDQEILSKKDAKLALKLIAPFVPFITEELWQHYGGENSIHIQPWPEYDISLIREDVVTIVVQINGKLRATLRVARQESKAKESVLRVAKENEKIKRFIHGKEIQKEIFVPGKLLNFVVG